MQGKSFCALLFGHRSVLRQDRFVSQKSFDEFDAVCGVICHGPSSPGAIYTHSKTNKERDSSSSSSKCQSEIVDSPGGADGQATEQQRENQAKRKLQGAGASVGINATACVRVMDRCMATNSSALFAKNWFCLPRNYGNSSQLPLLPFVRIVSLRERKC